MKEGFIIKLNWIVYKNEIIKNIPLLTAENPQKVYQNARRIYKQALKQMDEYGPAVNELREFYRKVVLERVFMQINFRSESSMPA